MDFDTETSFLMECQLLSIPSKKTETLDWVHPLKSFFNKHYGSYQEFSEQIHLFNKLRFNMESSNIPALTRDLLYGYYGQLELFDLRIPVNEFDGVHINFTWFDAFKSSKKVTQSSIAFEKLCVLFNLASVQTEIASTVLEEEKDYKTSYQSLQNAAGIYKFIWENFLNAPSNDLNQDTLKSLEQLCLAQAQEIFLMKILNGDNIKNSLVAKLAQAAATLYSNAHDLLDKVDDVDTKWVSYCKLKTKLFHSILYYHQSILIKETKLGEAIAFLKQAYAEVEDYKTNYSYFKYVTLELNCKKMIELIKRDLPTLEKDNDFIYHEAVPNFSTLTLKGLESVKSISINDQGLEKMMGKDLFEKIIPYSVQEQSSKYTELLASLLREEDENIVVSNEELASVLEYLNLPMKLNEIKLLTSLTQDDVKLHEQFNSSDNDYDVNKLKQNLNSLKKTCGDKLNELNLLIDSNNLHYNDKILDIRENISKTRQSLIAANETDQKIDNLIKPYDKELRILQTGQISSYLQNDKSLLDIDIDQNEITKAISAVEKNLSELNNLKYEKEKIYKSLRDLVHEDDIAKILILNKKNPNYEDIFANELLKFKPYQDRIKLLISKQEDSIVGLKKNFKNLLTNENYLSLSKNKSDYDTNYSKLSKTFESFNKYKNGYTQATKFYNDLLNFIKNLELEVLQIINTNQFSALNLNSTNANTIAPPLPPTFGSARSSYSDYSSQQQPPPPPIPPQHPQQTRQNSSSIYDNPSSFDPSMYTKFS